MEKIVTRVIKITLALNVVLATLKFGGGYFFASPSLISDGFNSLMDIFISGLLLFTFKIRNKGPDHNHPYGHEKFEGVAYLLLGFFILLTGLFIVISNGIPLFTSNDGKGVVTSSLALLVGGVALVIKFGLFLLNYQISKKYAAPSLKADALNHLLDIGVTTIALIGITLTKFGGQTFEYIASIIIGLVILIAAFKMLKEAVTYLVDTAPDEATIKHIEEVILSVPGVDGIDVLKVRTHMNKLYVDVEIGIDENTSFKKAHAISERVHHAVEREGGALHCMVHANPHKVFEIAAD